MPFRSAISTLRNSCLWPTMPVPGSEMSRSWKLKLVAELITQLQSFEFDVVHKHHSHTDGLSGRTASPSQNMPWMWFTPSSGHPWGGPSKNGYSIGSIHCTLSVTSIPLLSWTCTHAGQSGLALSIIIITLRYVSYSSAWAISMLDRSIGACKGGPAFLDSFVAQDPDPKWIKVYATQRVGFSERSVLNAGGRQRGSSPL